MLDIEVFFFFIYQIKIRNTGAMRLEFLVKIIYTFLICAIIKETILKN